MYELLPEYIINADKFFQLWLVAELKNPQSAVLSHLPNPTTRKKLNTSMAKSREDWLPELVELFDDVRDVPDVVRLNFPEYQLDNQLRFHSGNRKPTLTVEVMDLFWGVSADDMIGTQVLPWPVRAIGPCKVTYTDLKMWHHQNALHRRRGDAVICAQIDFEWNTKKGTKGAYRGGGPYKVTIKNFRAKCAMGTVTFATFDHLNVHWCTDNGARLSESRVTKILKKNDIGLNYLRAGESVFDDDGEEFIFWTEIDDK